VIKPVGLTELRWILGEPHAPSRVRPSLLIIDEPAVTASLARVLADDFAIQTASTCDVLGECLDEHRFDRILCDAKLARGLGDDVVRRLRARSERSTVVWMLEPASGTETGPELRKPFGRAALFEAVGARPLPITAGLDEERRHRADALLATMSRELGAAPTMLGRRQ
jgi:CheY-like chemotaxis protein